MSETLDEMRLAGLRGAGVQCFAGNAPIIRGETLVALVDEITTLRAQLAAARAEQKLTEIRARAFPILQSLWHRYYQGDGDLVAWIEDKETNRAIYDLMCEEDDACDAALTTTAGTEGLDTEPSAE